MLARAQSQAGSNNPRWRGGIQNSNGYVKILIESNLAPDGVRIRRYKGKHRLVMEALIGRSLSANEQVHHKDGDRSNNAVENLELRSGPHGIGATKHCPTCTCGGNYHAT
jgi:hypothetical protein